MVDFFINKNCDGISTASENWIKKSRFNSNDGWSDPIKIESITLDELIKHTFVPDILKIDVEGYENTVVRGLTKKANMIQFEWAEEEVASVEDACKYLKSIGYDNFAYKFGDLPYSFIPNEFISLEELKTVLFDNLDPNRKDKWGMIYTK